MTATEVAQPLRSQPYSNCAIKNHVEKI